MWTWYNLAVTKHGEGDKRKHLNAPAGLTWDEAARWLHDTFATDRDMYQVSQPQYSGYDTVTLGVGYVDQCNLAFDLSFIHMLSDADVELHISCYQEELPHGYQSAEVKSR